jgi:hypothetical protein
VTVTAQDTRSGLFSATPLTDYSVSELYLGRYPGFLYTGSNLAPAHHDLAGQAAADSIQPLDGKGKPSPTGKIVLVSMGMSNTTEEWCDGNTPHCAYYSFMGEAAASKVVNHTTLTIVDGAHKGAVANTWICAQGACASTPNQYDRVRDSVLTPAGLTEAQVQAVWVKVATKFPNVSLPANNADAFVLEGELGQIARAVRVRWPNVKQIFFSSRIYAGYSTTDLSPEPFAYESGFAVKWAIQAQITQRDKGVVDHVAGDLLTNAPWIGWGPYIWGDGSRNARGSDALTWMTTDYINDLTHPNATGVTQVAGALLEFFTNSVYTSWFRAH